MWVLRRMNLWENTKPSSLGFARLGIDSALFMASERLGLYLDRLEINLTV